MMDGESQTDEICALKSIFTEEEFKSSYDNDTNVGQFYAFVTLPDGFTVLIKDLREDSGNEEIEITLKFLPPIEISFTLPPDYPSLAPPWFTISCLWLKKELLMRLCEELERLWEENKGSEILFIWMQFLKEESLSFLGITDSLDLTEIKQQIYESKILQEKQNNPSVEKQLPVDNLNANSKQCDNISLADTKSKLELGLSNTSENGNSSRDLPLAKSSGASGEFSGHRTQQMRYNRRPHSINHHTGLDKAADQKNSFQGKNQSSRSGYPVRNEYSFDNHKRYIDRSNSESNESVRRYERRKPRFVDGRNDYKSNTPGYESNKNYRRHKSPVERKISDNSLKKFETNDCSKTELADKDVESLEGKRLFEKNRRYKNYDKDKFASIDSPNRKTDGYNNVSRTFYNNRYQARRGKNRRQQSSKPSEPDTIEKMVDNLEIIEEIKSEQSVSELNESAKSESRDHIVEPQIFFKHLHLFLQDYNKDQIRMQFLKNVYTCNICFEDKLGSESTQFMPCEHVFCRDCVSGYFEVRIKDGAVHNIMCPENKCSSEALPSQVRDMVSPELFGRYDSILLSTTLDTMSDIVFCPRSSCQYPTTKEEGSKMARCPSCNYAFCVYCRMVYHGIEGCRFKNEEKKIIYEEYEKADENHRQFMEQKYGKKQLLSMVEIIKSEVWIDEYSKKCPHCNAAIEKFDGCNKMICTKCETYFCWTCEIRLDPKAPYNHFSDPNSRCYNRLFQGAQPEPDEIDL